MTKKPALLTLHLNFIREWFVMIEAGKKREEYRELSKYYFDRLTTKEYRAKVSYNEFLEIVESGNIDAVEFTPYTHVIGYNGYNKDAPQISWLHEGTTIGKPRRGWAPEAFLNKRFFILRIGEIKKRSQ